LEKCLKMPKFKDMAKNQGNHKVQETKYLKDLKQGDRFMVAGTGSTGIVENIGTGSVQVTYDSYSRINEFGVKEHIRARRIGIARRTVVICLNTADL